MPELPVVEYEITQFEKILHSKKIRYEIMKPIFEQILPEVITVGDKEYPCDTVNFFVDVYSIYNQVFNPETINVFSSMNKKEKNKFASHVLNLAGHYRNFFAKYCGKYTNIYLYYPTKPCADKIKIESMFRREYYEKRINFENPTFGVLAKLLNRNIEIARMIGVYLPHIYLIDTKDIDHLVVPDLIIKESKLEHAFNLILSNDLLNLGAVSRYENTFLLNCKGERSEVVDTYNIANIMTEAKSVSTTDNQSIRYFFDYIVALVGNKKMGIPPITGFTILKAIRVFNKLIEHGDIQLKSYENYVMISNILVEKGLINDKDAEQFERNFKLLSQDHYSGILSQGKKLSILSQVTDKVDRVGLMTLNQDSFYREPLNFEMLFIGEEYI